MGELINSYLLEKHGVVLSGHFKLTSGKHSNTYINKDSIYCKTDLFELVIRNMIFEIAMSFNGYEVITGPAIAGAILAAPIANTIGKTFVYPEKVEDQPLHGDPSKWWKMEFRRGYDKVIKDKRVLIVEDIITTGSSVEKTIKAIQECDGIPIGVMAIWNRTGWHKLSIKSLINEKVDSWWPQNNGCPLCIEGVPLQDTKEI